jgi:hypothetical protein
MMIKPNRKGHLIKKINEERKFENGLGKYES